MSILTICFGIVQTWFKKKLNQLKDWTDWTSPEEEEEERPWEGILTDNNADVERFEETITSWADSPRFNRSIGRY